MKRSIHPTIFRAGSFNRWEGNEWNISDAESRSQLQDSVQAWLKSVFSFQFNVAVIKCSLQAQQAQTVDVSVVGYKYIQRARLTKSLRLALLIATGVFKNKPPLYHVRLSQGFVLPMPLISKLEQMLKASFGKNFRLTFYNISRLADDSFGKLEGSAKQQLKNFFRAQERQLRKTKGQRSWPPMEAQLETTWVDPIGIRNSYYRYKAFASLVYSLDVIMVTLYSSIYSLSALYADLIIHGLLRNMKRHRQFLNLIETALHHFGSFSSWPFKPFHWVVGLHGKIGSGTIRSRSMYIKTGDALPLQTLKLPVSYAYRNADTKYGSIGVKVWMRKSR